MRRLAFVIQRYGREVNGGAEELCRQVAERLCREIPLDILTTCARDYLTWANFYPAGVETANGVKVRRFPTVRERRVRAFGRFSQKVYGRPHTFTQEAEWMERQGPEVPGLYDYIRKHGRDYALFVFFTYLYPPTFFGLPLVAEKSVLLPMAHDEPPLHLDMFRPLFHMPRAFIFNTDEERRFVHETFRNSHVPSIVAGAGIDLPPLKKTPSPRGDYLLYLGRVDVEKGCNELLDFFQRYKKARPSPLKLLLAGDINMKVPRDHDIVPLGFVSNDAKATLLASAKALVLPSRHESLSLVALEAWAAATPVVAHRGSRVLVEHMERCGGGWLYSGFNGFLSSLDGELNNSAARARRGLAGRRYVSRNYGWGKVLGTYSRFFKRVANKVREDGADRD